MEERLSMKYEPSRAYNRRLFIQPDYVLALVIKPEGWKPQRLDDVPPQIEVVKHFPVASFPEALDDVYWNNRLSLKYSFDLWAIVQSPNAEL